MSWSRVMADLIVVFHACYVGFMVLGLAAILIGAVCRWTVWEKQLRVRAGQATYPGDFLGYWVHRLIFYQAEPWVFTLIYATFGLAVVAALVLAPPRLHAIKPNDLDGRPPQSAR